MEKINWINGQVGGTPLSAENLNQMQDNIETAIEEVENKTQRHIITASRSRMDVTVNVAWEKVELPCNKCNLLGDKLIFENGKIKIGKGVSKVSVSATCSGIQMKNSDKSFSLFKSSNGVEESINSVYSSGDTTSNFLGFGLTQTLINVKEGDLIYLTAMSQYAETFNVMDCFFTVEAIE